MNRYNVNIKQENEFDLNEYEGGIIITDGVTEIHEIQQQQQHVNIQEQQPQHHEFIIQHPQIILHDPRIHDIQSETHYAYIQNDPSDSNQTAIHFTETSPLQQTSIVASIIPAEIHLSSNLLETITKLELHPLKKIELHQNTLIPKTEITNITSPVFNDSRYPQIVSVTSSDSPIISTSGQNFIKIQSNDVFIKQQSDNEEELINEIDKKENRIENDENIATCVETTQYNDDININIVCKVCKENFVGVGNFNEHMKTHSQGEQEDAEIVGATKIEMVDLAETLNSNKSVYPCAFCNKKYIWHKFLVTHSKLHNDPGTFTCTICGDSFDCLYYDHMKTHLLKEERICTKCNEQFPTLKDLRIHMKSKHEAKINPVLKHKCNVCGKFYKALSYLKEHERIHTGEKPYTCDVCGKGFAKYGCFAEHKKTHSIVKAFKCPMCPKAFTKRRYLKAHLLRHPKTLDLDKIFIETNEGEFPARKFLFAPNKKESIEKPPQKLECPICFKEFKKMRYLRGHVARHPDSFVRQKLGIKPDMPIPALISSGPYNENNLMKNNKNSLINFSKSLSRYEVKNLSSDESSSSSSSDDDDEESSRSDVENDKEMDGREKGEIDAEGNFDIQHLEESDKDEIYLEESNPLENSQSLESNKNGKNLFCEICNKNFIENSTLLEHKLVHFGENPFSCSLCNISFALQNRFNEHMIKIHKTSVDLNENSNKLNANRYLNIEEKSFICKICTETFFTENMLEEHEEIHLGENPFKCEYCEQLFASHHNFMCHEKSHEITVEKPILVERVLRSNKSKANKVQNETIKVKKTKSSVTKKKPPLNKVITRSTSRNPKKSKGSDDEEIQEQVYKCEICNEKFIDALSYDKHKEIHKIKTKYKCKVCDLEFKMARNLKIHMRRHRTNTKSHDVSNLFQCDKCDKNFQTKSSLNEHIKIHINEAPFKCPYCAKIFMLTSSFKDHIQKHENIETHQCPFCSKSFIKARYLQQHLVRHIQKLDDGNILNDSLDEDSKTISDQSCCSNNEKTNSLEYIPSADGQSLVHIKDINNL